MAIGENIRKLRKEKGLTQKQLGLRCGIDEANIRKYELGNANPKVETIQKIAAALDVHYYSLFDDIYSVPELKYTLHSDDLGLFELLLEDNIIPCTKHDKKTLLNNMRKDIDAGKDINPNKVEEYYNNLSVKYSHILLDYMLKECGQLDIYYIVQIIAYFLRMTSNTKSLFIDLLTNMYDDMIFDKEK